MSAIKTPTRPIVRWHGGKWLLAPWIISHIPKHRVYTETFGGAASVLLRKERAYAEIYNDLDGGVVNLFRVVRDSGDDLNKVLSLTPYSRNEFLQSYEKTNCDFENARRLVVRSFMGFGTNACGFKKTGFRANSNRSGTTPAHDWANYPDALKAIISRLQGVVIENRDAMEVMLAQDSEETLHYVDPPYLKSTRADHGDDYNFEMTDQDHIEMIDALKGLQGKVLISGYESDLYDRELSGWHKVSKDAFADGALKRIEVLWANYSFDEINADNQKDMFS